MLKILLLLPLFFAATPESLCRRMQAHLLIDDKPSALEEAREAVVLFPKHPLVYEMALRSFAVAGSDSEMMELWKLYNRDFPECAMKQEILEQMCWGVLKKGGEAPGINTQLISIIGSALARDMYAVSSLLAGLRHENAHIRAVSVELAALYGDQPLREELLRLFREEKVFEVRLLVLKALATLHTELLLPELMARVSDPSLAARERKEVIEALVQIRDRVEREELEVLVTHPRAALRQLACETIAFCQSKEHADLLHTLALDTNPEVQVAALRGLGLLRVPPTRRIKRLSRKTSDPRVGITAGWVWLLGEPQQGAAALGEWLEHKDEEVRVLAASAVAAAGPFGVALAKERISESTDPYVQVNLALALIGQREACKFACEVLARFLRDTPERLMFSGEGLFRPLQNSTLSHNPAMANYPDVVDQTVRLELINLLAILDYPGANEAIKAFLKERRWEVTGLAAETLLGEGDETAIDQVRALLEDSDPQIRAEAALALAVWGRDQTAVPTLLAVYPKAERSLQIKLLEALGRIGDKQTIPFLLERLEEPSLTIRMIAASVLLQTLNS